MAAAIALSAASPALRLLPQNPHPKRSSFSKLHPHRSSRKLPAIANCTPNPTSDFESNPQPSDDDTQRPSPTFPLEKRWPSVIDHRPRTSIQRPDPPNYEIGWKRTKEINNEKPKGFVIADFLEKLETLMDRQYGTTDLLAKVGEIVAERAREEAEVLREGGEVEERLITELYRVLRLMEMDLEMVRAAVKEETLEERIEKAKARCRQAILVALSF